MTVVYVKYDLKCDWGFMINVSDINVAVECDWDCVFKVIYVDFRWASDRRRDGWAEDSECGVSIPVPPGGGQEVPF